MQRHPQKLARIGRLAATLVLLSCGLAQTQEFEGAWKLTRRKLPNGSTLTPPVVQGALFGVVADDWQRIGWRDVPARGDIRGRPMRRDREDERDLSDIGGEADAATHAASIEALD